MTKSISAALLLLTFFAAAALQAADANAQKDAFVLPGDVVIPQVASGGDGVEGLFMTFQAVNFTTAPASVQVSFFDSSGNPMVLNFQQDGAPVTASFLSKALGAKGSSFARTFPMGATQVGYARVQSTPANSVAVIATFNQQVTGRPLFQTLVPLSSAIQDRFMVPVLNSGANTGAIAIVSLAAQDINFAVRDTNGVSLCQGMISLPAGGHIAVVVRDQAVLNCAAGRDTMIEVSGPQKALAGIGITAQDSGAFSSLPAYGSIPAAAP